MADEPAFFGDLGAAAEQLHKMYAAFISAGFTEEQAMQIVTAVMAAGVK